MPDSLSIFVFCDFSGDFGFKFKFGSSQYLTLALIIFRSESNLENIRRSIKDLKDKHKLNPNYEFKFSAAARFRKIFLETARDENFSFRVKTINKLKLEGKSTQEKHHTLLRLIASVFVDLGSVKLTIDEQGSLKSTRKFLKDLKPHLSKVRIIKRRITASHKEELLQLADMVCGAVHRKSTKNDDSFYKIIQPKENHTAIPT